MKSTSENGLASTIENLFKSAFNNSEPKSDRNSPTASPTPMSPASKMARLETEEMNSLLASSNIPTSLATQISESLGIKVPDQDGPIKLETFDEPKTTTPGSKTSLDEEEKSDFKKPENTDNNSEQFQTPETKPLPSPKLAIEDISPNHVKIAAKMIFKELQQQHIVNAGQAGKFTCKFCEITFPDNILYGLHMGQHCMTDPFKCNLCGYMANDRYDFMCHYSMGHCSGRRESQKVN